MKIELCIDTFEEALAAEKYGIDRIELCSALVVGGLTPSLGLIEKCAQLTNIETHVMVRPRGGGFVYSPDEIEIMMEDIRKIAKTGAKGVVFGILDEIGNIDLNNSNRLLIQAKSLGLEVTFHRAFDLVNNPNQVLQQLIDLGFDRVLTSGQQPTAIEGVELIRQLKSNYMDNIQIMAGSGVNANDVKTFIDAGVDAVHFTARKESAKLPLNMGTDIYPDTNKIEQILQAANRI